MSSSFINGKIYLKLKKPIFNYRVKQQIRAPELRVIGTDGKQLGVLKLTEALAKASELELDLIEIAPTAKPPVAKITELGKFRYQEEKKLKKERKNSKASELKEIRLSPFIADHDFANRTERIAEFLAEKNKVRVVVVFAGRQMNSKEFGYEVLKRVVKKFEGKIAVDMEPKFFGRYLGMVISPVNSVKGERQEVKENTK